MRQVREVLRLKHVCGHSGHQIAVMLGVSRYTVAEYLRRAAVVGITWPVPAALDDVALERKLFTPPFTAAEVLRPQPEWARIHAELRRPGVTLLLLWEEYRAGQPDGYGYSRFCDLARSWRGRLSPTMRQTHPAGERLFVDYAGQTAEVIDGATGEIRRAQIFVAVLGASMLTHPTTDRLRELGLADMARALEEQRRHADAADLGFEDRLAMLVEREALERDSKRLATRLRFAGLRQQATPEDVDHRATRGLDRALFQKLTGGEWIERHQDLLVTGPTGTGKTWLSCALGHRACRDNRSVLYQRVPRLLEALGLARGDGRYGRMLKTLARVQLLILDDWAITPLTAEQRRDLMEIVDDRHDRASTIVTSQVPVELWHEHIGNPTIADAVLDRLVHGANRIELKGESMRKLKAAKAKLDEAANK
jgi:DNA replication protein DnaC